MIYTENDIRKAIEAYLKRNGFETFDLQCALFDMDGVLFNSMPYHASSWNKAMKDFGMNLPEYEAFLHEGRTGEATINIVMQREWGRTVTEKELKDIYARKSMYFDQCPTAKPIDGAKQLVTKMREDGILATIVTGSGQKSLLGKIQNYYDDLFCLDRMVTAFDVKYGKPNPEPYLIGLKKMNVQPNQAIVVENAPLGVEAGHAASVFTVAVNTGPIDGSALIESGADLLFSSMAEFIEHWDMFFNVAKSFRHI